MLLDRPQQCSLHSQPRAYMQKRHAGVTMTSSTPFPLCQPFCPSSCRPISPSSCTPTVPLSLAPPPLPPSPCAPASVVQIVPLAAAAQLAPEMHPACQTCREQADGILANGRGQGGNRWRKGREGKTDKSRQVYFDANIHCICLGLRPLKRIAITQLLTLSAAVLGLWFPLPHSTR